MVSLTEQERAAVADALDEITRFVIRQMGEVGELSLSAAATLSMLRSAGPCRVSDLAAQEGITQPSMTGLVTRLERQGYVERRHDPSDGRIVLVAITEAGLDILRRRQAARVAFLSSLIGELTPADQRAIADAAGALRHLTSPEAVPVALAAAVRAVVAGDEGTSA
jgi:DNA-binding MarR family transcriptional regulator